MDRLTLAFMAAEWSPTAWGYDERGTCFKEAYYWQGFDPEARRELNDLFQSFHRTGRRPERLADLQAHPRYAEAVAWALPRTRECNAMFLLFDRTAQDPALSYFLGYDDYRAGLERMFDAFGFYQDDVVFKGYWRTGEWINGQTDTLKTSAYLRKPAGKTLLLTTNLDDDPVSTQLVVDAAALGLDGSIGWTCAETGKAIRTVPSADGRTAIHVDIPGRNYIAVLGERLDMGDGSNRE